MPTPCRRRRPPVKTVKRQIMAPISGHVPVITVIALEIGCTSHSLAVGCVGHRLFQPNLGTGLVPCCRHVSPTLEDSFCCCWRPSNGVSIRCCISAGEVWLTSGPLDHDHGSSKDTIDAIRDVACLRVH